MGWVGLSYSFMAHSSHEPRKLGTAVGGRVLCRTLLLKLSSLVAGFRHFSSIVDRFGGFPEQWILELYCFCQRR